MPHARLLAFAVVLAGCTLVMVRPDAPGDRVIRTFMLGNAHVTVCRPNGTVTRARSATATPATKDTPTGADVLDVTMQGECVEVTGGSTSANLVIAVGLVAAAAATVLAVLV